MCNLRATVRSIIDTGDASAPIDVYAVAEALHAFFPEREVSELAEIVSEVAVRRTGRSMLWEPRAR